MLSKSKGLFFVGLLALLLSCLSSAPTLALPQGTSVSKEDSLRFAPTGGQLTSGFGWRSDPFTGQSRFHSGLDVATAEGSPVYAPQAGVVVFSGVHGGYGNVVVLHHGGKLFTLYGHNSKLLVVQGQTVDVGQPIALVGATGRATGPHLHFEVHNHNHYQDPKVYLLAIQKQWLAEGKLPNGSESLPSTTSLATASKVSSSSSHKHFGTTFRHWLGKEKLGKEKEEKQTKAPVPELDGVGGSD